MTQKVVNITIKNLDITQLRKCAESFQGTATMNPTCVAGAYNKELNEFICQLIDAGYEGKTELQAHHMTI
jgi:hypothetical protein